VNETKLRNHLKCPELRFASDDQIKAAGAVPGFASPMGVNPASVRIVFDPSARESGNLVVGANESDYHYRNFNFDRDLGDLPAKVEVVDLATAREGDPDPVAGKPLQMRRGIEVGNIFQLGTKYSAAMNCVFLDANGKPAPMIMGCYGIGVGRGLAAVIEQSHDQYGPVWPFGIAPFEVHMCALNLAKEGVRPAAENLYQQLTSAGVEVLFDDRDEKAGSAFNDADLIGVPFRLIVSPKNLANRQVEFKTRDGKRQEMLPLEGAVAAIVKLVEEERERAKN
jgi:prolyl-tRNA synthetase